MTRENSRSRESDSSADDLPELQLRDGDPPVIDTIEDLREYAAALAAGTGPVALDAERASGYRYSMRAYLVQVRREGAGIALIDPVPLPDLKILDAAIGDAEWILHAATQDLPCLAEVGMRPRRLFDTEVAGRILGRDRVSLAALVGSELGLTLHKGQGATDWSTRPLSPAQLTYAALDVEPLVELRDVLHRELIAADRWNIAQQEFEHLLGFQPRDRGPEPWRRLSGMHKLTSPRQWAVARELWLARDDLAERTDTAPGRLIPDSAIVAAVLADPTSVRELMEADGFHGRGAGKYRRSWWEAIERARSLPKADLPQRAARSEGPPPPRSWADKDPVAANRLAIAREAVTALSEELSMAPELLLAPDLMRRLCWDPPSDADEAGVRRYLAAGGAREWQVDLCTPFLVNALRAGMES